MPSFKLNSASIYRIYTLTRVIYKTRKGFQTRIFGGGHCTDKRNQPQRNSCDKALLHPFKRARRWSNDPEV